jgi:hypothetical protein
MSPKMTPLEIKDLANPKLRKIAKRVVNEVMLATEKVVAHGAEPANFPLPEETDSMERILWQRYNELGEANRAFSRARMMPRVKASESARTRVHKDLAGIDLRSKESVAKQAAKLPWPQGLTLSAADLEDVAANADAQEDNLVPQQTNDKLELSIVQVKCIDETNSFFAPEGAGNDEIKLGGVTVDATGVTQSIAPFMVSENFDDGETRTFNPPRRFATFDLRKGTEFPKAESVIFALAEQDSGGILSFVNKLTAAIKDSVTKKLTTLLGAKIGATGGPIGVAIGTAVGFVVGKVFDALADAFGDDVFKPVTVSLLVQSLAHTFDGGKTEDRTRSVDFKGHNGHYRLFYRWRVFA